MHGEGGPGTRRMLIRLAQLGWIKLEGDKLRKLDLYLEPPVIEYATRRDKKLVFPVTDDEMANGKEESLGPQHEQPDEEEARDVEG